MARSDVKIRPGRELYGELHRDSAFVAALKDKADDVVQGARARAPKDSGDYANSIRVVTDSGRTAGFVKVIVEATDFKAPWIEFGTPGRVQDATGRFTGFMPAYSPLRKGARAAGLRLRSSKRATRTARQARAAKKLSF